MFKKYAKVIRFIISGSFVAFVGLAVLHVFTEWFHVWYLFSSTISFFVALFLNFLLQKYWTFQGNDGKIHVQGGLFFLSALLYLALNTALMYGMVDIVGIHYIFAQATVMVLLSIMNYFIYQGIIFRPVRN